MRKVPTLFERDWNGDRSRVLPGVHPGCEWVLAGEGVPTRKLDGTCCMIRDGRLYKRQEIGLMRDAPADFEEVDRDPETGKRVGWRPVGDGPEDEWHRKGFACLVLVEDGTYELVGPKVQGNPEDAPFHVLIPHTAPVLVLGDAPRDFDAIREYLAARDIEGIVFHHADGRMAKVKRRDFGLPWPPPGPVLKGERP